MKSHVGVDEAGRGCLAGPVYAAAVVLPDALELPKGVILRDSKTMTALQRARARAFIEENALAWGVASASPGIIDRLNILKATHQAMHDALDVVFRTESLGSRPERILVDGDRFRPYICPVSDDFVPNDCIVKGDGSHPAIAAASILAKTHRDEYVLTHMHPLHPMYGWDKNKGYGTALHMTAIKQHGPCNMHRMTFAPLSQSFV